MTSADNDCIDFDDAFSLEVDNTTPDEGTDSTDQPEEVLVIPQYSTTFTDFLCVPEYEMDTGKLVGSREAPRRKMSCFNCLGDHSVSDCPEPKDFSAISRNRRAHLNSRPAQSVRYHEQFSNKYGHFCPGVMSPTLRHALGLESHQIAETVYRMRVLGYPPGWLMEAREQTGEVLLIGGDGKAVCQPGGEDGEVSGGAKYQPEKLVEYPGFNAPLPEDMQEEGEWYNLPYMKDRHNLQTWRAIMNKNKAAPYRKRKMRPANTGDVDADDSQGSSNITLDDSVVELPQTKKEKLLEDGEVDSEEAEPTKKKKQKKNKKDKKKSVQDSSDVSQSNDTITLDDTSDIFLDTEPAEVVADEASSSSPEPAAAIDMANRLLVQSASEDDSNASSGVRTKKHRRRSKGFVLGAVIPESITQFKELPDFEKWTVDVTDHILFENLPDALGTWDTMRGIMKKVRSKISELHADD